LHQQPNDFSHYLQVYYYFLALQEQPQQSFYTFVLYFQLINAWRNFSFGEEQLGKSLEFLCELVIEFFRGKLYRNLFLFFEIRDELISIYPIELLFVFEYSACVLVSCIQRLPEKFRNFIELLIPQILLISIDKHLVLIISISRVANFLKDAPLVEHASFQEYRQN
jgi:hypothetical protein